MAEVAQHCTASDGWFVFNGVVYDATVHLKEIQHVPGKTSTYLAILQVLGSDCSTEMMEIQHSERALAQMQSFRIGILK